MTDGEKKNNLNRRDSASTVSVFRRGLRLDKIAQDLCLSVGPEEELHGMQSFGAGSRERHSMSSVSSRICLNIHKSDRAASRQRGGAKLSGNVKCPPSSDGQVS